MTEKDSNPKDALGIMKVPFHAIPSKPLMEIGLAMLEGGRKYGTHNYRSIGVRMSTYYDAALRHIIAWWEGEDIDPESGMHHTVKAMSSLIVLRDSMHMGNCEDDRPIAYPDGINMIYFNKLAADIIKKYPECKEPFLQINKAIGGLKIPVVASPPPIDEQQSQDERADEVAGLELADENKAPAVIVKTVFCSAPACMNRGPINGNHSSHFCDEHAEQRTWEYCREPNCVKRGERTIETSDGSKLFLCKEHEDYDYGKSD